MHTVIVDGYTANPGDLTWEEYARFGTYTVYPRTEETDPALLISRIRDADAIVVNKNNITRAVMEACPRLKFICEAATGYNNIDIGAARERNIAVCNVPGYSTAAVAQHTIALLLEISNRIGIHSRAVRRGEWAGSPDFCFTLAPLSLLEGKSMGIIGYGAIGKKTAEIAAALGMEIRIYSRDPAAALASDIVSLHCPLTEENRAFVNRDFIEKMKDGAILLNTARGGLIHEEDLARALRSGKIAAYAADVLTAEPPARNHPLTGLENCFFTPHIAWTPLEVRRYMIRVCIENQQSFLDGGSLNRIV